MVVWRWGGGGLGVGYLWVYKRGELHTLDGWWREPGGRRPNARNPNRPPKSEEPTRI